MDVNEKYCSITVNDKTFTNRGAFVDEQIAFVYVNRVEKLHKRLIGSKITVSTWDGKLLGHGHITNEWVRNGLYFRYRFVNVRFVIDGVTYSGNFNYDNGQLVRGKRVKTK